jgi:hypothetical protein
MLPEERFQYAIEKGYSYDPISGIVKGPNGGIIRKSTTRGYLSMCVYAKDGKFSLLQHRFAWYFIHAYLPKYIDHKNRDTADNRLENLRDVTQSQNSFNCKNTKGYSFSKSKGRYRASIMVNGKSKTIGYYIREGDAAEAYKEAKIKYHII